MEFEDRMVAVDKFIYTKIAWKEDMGVYGVVGLLTSPDDVLSRRMGDCQGQAAVTTSLLASFGGYQAYSVETPFHWWTHCKEISTGYEYSLNSRGHGALDGDVTPQPIDMVYTWYPPRCTNCSAIEALNTDTFHYVAPPWRAFMIAFSGMHIFQRSILPVFAGASGKIILILIGVATGVVGSLYSGYFHCDLIASLTTPEGRLRLLKRFALGTFLGVSTMLLMYFWGSVYYNAALIHTTGMIAFTIHYVCSESFNRKIGTPLAMRASERDEAQLRA